MPPLVIHRHPPALLLFFLRQSHCYILQHKILHIARSLPTSLAHPAIIAGRAMGLQTAILHGLGQPDPAEVPIGEVVVGDVEELLDFEFGAVAESHVAGGVRPACAARDGAVFVGAARAGLAIVAVVGGISPSAAAKIMIVIFSHDK